MEFINKQIHEMSLPQLEEVSLIRISKHYFKIIAFNKLLLYGVLFVLWFFAQRFLDNEFIQRNISYIGFILLVVCICDFAISYVAFKKRQYAVRTHDIIYAKGLLTYSITTVPISRIQHIEESRSWLARQLKVSTLKIYTAGESGSDLSIKGLPEEKAKEINNFISSKVNGDNGLFTTH